MLLCTRDHITDLLLAAYVDACEKQNPGLTERTIEAVSGEIGTILSHRYPQPWPEIPELVRYIASVFSAYRIVQAITSLVRSEGLTENEWIPLQKQWQHCNGLLDAIRDGKLKLPLPEVGASHEDPSVAVVTREPLFNLRGFSSCL